MSIDFEGKRSTQKGAAGEKLVCEWLSERGHIIYVPEFKGPHACDRIMVHYPSREVIAFDVKTKPKRAAYPDTGINLTSFYIYDSIQLINKIRFFLFFVDEEERTVYGETLNALKENRDVIHRNIKYSYPLRDNGIIYFPRESMKTIFTLSEEEVAPLLNLRDSDFVKIP